MLKFITDTLCESDGSPSTVRLIATITSLVVLAMWTITSYKSGVLAAVSPEQLAFALGPLGFKVLQKSKETAVAAAPTA